MEWMLMPLKRYADFRGRSRRQEFWMWQLAKMLVGLVFAVLMAVVFGASLASVAGDGSASAGAAVGIGVGAILYLLLLVLGLAIIVPDIAVTVRRLHDTERSGMWLFAIIVPYVIGYILIGAGAVAGSSILAGLGTLIVFGGFIMGIVLLVFCCLDGTPGPNRYGADPKLRGETVPPAY